MNKVFKNLLVMTGISLIGIIVGALISVVFGAILDLFYHQDKFSFLGAPQVPIAGGVVGGILAAVLAMRSFKNE